MLPQTHDALRTEILSLALSPGQPLDETTLAERFDLSRSPVREALIRLAGEELVVILPNRSTIVAPIEIASFPKYVEALDITQRMNTRLAAALRTDADLKLIVRRQRDFEEAVEEGDHLLMSEANKDFHMAIARAGSPGSRGTMRNVTRTSSSMDISSPPARRTANPAQPPPSRIRGTRLTSTARSGPVGTADPALTVPPL